jgi:hypothetical protein
MSFIKISVLKYKIASKMMRPMKRQNTAFVEDEEIERQHGLPRKQGQWNLKQRRAQKDNEEDSEYSEDEEEEEDGEKEEWEDGEDSDEDYEKEWEKEDYGDKDEEDEEDEDEEPPPRKICKIVSGQIRKYSLLKTVKSFKELEKCCFEVVQKRK